jgi:hypothetical protein
MRILTGLLDLEGVVFDAIKHLSDYAVLQAFSEIANAARLNNRCYKSGPFLSQSGQSHWLRYCCDSTLHPCCCDITRHPMFRSSHPALTATALIAEVI